MVEQVATPVRKADDIKNVMDSLARKSDGALIVLPDTFTLVHRDADGPVGVIGHRHGHRSRSLMGTFGRTEIEVPRARPDGPDGKTTEWKSKTLRAHQRRPLTLGFVES
jgi:hypothetical protein